MTTEREHIDRRTFLGVSASCSAHFLCVAAGSSPSTRQFLSHALQQRIIAREPWGRLEQIGEGLCRRRSHDALQRRHHCRERWCPRRGELRDA
jgi:hypothetical protein